MQKRVDQIVGITNFVVSFVGPIAVLMLLAGAIMYTNRSEKIKSQKL